MHDQLALGCEVVNEVNVHAHQCGSLTVNSGSALSGGRSTLLLCVLTKP
jgi:hypothetical protein